jgi:hypothetical protein
MNKLFEKKPTFDVQIKSNNKRGRSGKKDKAGPALIRIEYVHQTK